MPKLHSKEKKKETLDLNIGQERNGTHKWSGSIMGKKEHRLKMSMNSGRWDRNISKDNMRARGTYLLKSCYIYSGPQPISDTFLFKF